MPASSSPSSRRVQGGAKGGTKSANVAPVAPETFEQAIEELETLVQRMEGGELSLEASLAAYRRGTELVTFCRRSLTEVQQQVRILEGDLLKAFDADEGQDA
jgi:exodeoxyribonuclease VII small subunit